MVVLSDRSIREGLNSGSIAIRPFDKSQLGPISYDLVLDRLYERDWTRRIPEEEPFAEPKDIPTEEFLEGYCLPLNWPAVLEPRKSYFARGTEFVTAKSFAKLSSRSAAARHGIEIMSETGAYHHGDMVYFQIRTANTRVRVPQSYPLAQVFFVCGLPMHLEEIRVAVAAGDITLAGKQRYVIMENTAWFGYLPSADSLLLHLGPELKRYKGSEMNVAEDHSDNFEEVDITKGYVLRPGEFYLGCTEEVSLGSIYAGEFYRLFRDFGFAVHANSPWIQPGSSGNQVLEMYVKREKPVRAGMPICRMEVHRVDREPEVVYGTRPEHKYAGQNGAVTSMSHLDFR